MATIESLQAKSERVGDCLIWRSNLWSTGYGYVWHEGKNRAAHRLSYELSIGPIPDGLDLMHSCDTPACIEPSHLSPGSHSENIQQMVDRNRRNTAKGSRHGMAKLTSDQVLLIRERYKPYCRANSTSAIARDLGVSQRAVWCAIKGETWA